jgi:hypothetical protein
MGDPARSRIGNLGRTSTSSASRRRAGPSGSPLRGSNGGHSSTSPAGKNGCALGVGSGHSESPLSGGLGWGSQVRCQPQHIGDRGCVPSAAAALQSHASA